MQDRARKELLGRLASNTRNSAAAELARELLAGHVTPRQIVESQLYADAIEESTNDFTDWYGGLSNNEKDAEAANGEQAMRELAKEHTSDPSTTSARRPRAGDEDDLEDFSDRSWLRGR